MANIPKSCVDALTKFVSENIPRGKFSSSSLRDMTDTLVNRVNNRLRESPSLSQADMIEKVQNEMIEEHAQGVREKKIIARMKAITEGELRKSLAENGWNIKRIRQEINGIISKNPGTRDGATQTRMGRETQFKAQFIKQLNDKGLWRKFHARDAGKDIYNAIAEIKGALPSRNIDDPQIKEIASIITDMQKRMVNVSHRYGIPIRELEERIIGVTHDPLKLMAHTKDWTEKFKQLNDGTIKLSDRRAFQWATNGLKKISGHDTTGEAYQRSMEASYQLWKEDLFPRLNMAKSFEDVENTPSAIDTSNRNRFAAIVKQMNQVTDLDGPKLSFKPGSTFAQMAAGGRRSYFFKDADSEYGYQKKWGQGDMRKLMVHEIGAFSRNTAIAQHFGPDALNTVKKMLGEVANKGPHGAKTKSLVKHELNVFANLTQTASSPVNYKAAKINSNIRSYIDLVKLGGVTLHSTGDIASSAMSMRIRDENLLTAFTKSTGFGLRAFKNMVPDLFRDLPKFPDAEQKVADELGSYVHAWTGSINRFGSETIGDGAMTKLEGLNFRLNGLQTWDSNFIHGGNADFARQLAINKDTSWDNLGVGVKQMLGQYNFLEKEWDLLRSLPLLKETDGKTYMAANGIREATKADLSSYMGVKPSEVSSSEAEELKDSLEVRLLGMYHDRANYNIQFAQPGDKALTNMGLQPGTVPGELARYFTRYKAFGIGFVRRALGQWIHANPYSDKANFGALAELMGGTLLFNAFGNAVLGVATNKQPNLEDPWFWVDAGLPMAGVYTDMFEAASNKYGTSTTSQLLGPAAGLLDKNVSAIASMFQPPGTRPRESHVAGQLTTRHLLNTVKGDTAYANLLYFKGIIDYMVSSQLLQRIDPNAVTNMVKQANQNNTPYIVNPS